MRIRSIHPLIVLPILATSLYLTASGPAYGQRGPRSPRSSFYYSSSSNILRGQLALQREGHLEEGTYEPGRYDAPTREAIRDFQRRHHLWSNGRFDRDTFALLPIDDRPDEDDDGIPDAGDRCPKTNKGSRAGMDGCPLPDEEKSSSATDSGEAKD
jgi:hypothetical protein